MHRTARLERRGLRAPRAPPDAASSNPTAPRGAGSLAAWLSPSAMSQTRHVALDARPWLPAAAARGRAGRCVRVSVGPCGAALSTACAMAPYTRCYPRARRVEQPRVAPMRAHAKAVRARPHGCADLFSPRAVSHVEDRSLRRSHCCSPAAPLSHPSTPEAQRRPRSGHGHAMSRITRLLRSSAVHAEGSRAAAPMPRAPCMPARASRARVRPPTHGRLSGPGAAP